MMISDITKIHIKRNRLTIFQKNVYNNYGNTKFASFMSYIVSARNMLMLSENQFNNAKVSKINSAAYEDMVHISTEKSIDDKLHHRSLDNEEDLLLLSQAVDSVLSANKNIKITELKNKNYSNVRKRRNYSVQLDDQELSDIMSELKLTKMIISNKQKELDYIKSHIYNRDKVINDMEKQLYSALDKMLKFVVKYEQYLL